MRIIQRIRNFISCGERGVFAAIPRRFVIRATGTSAHLEGDDTSRSDLQYLGYK